MGVVDRTDGANVFQNHDNRLEFGLTETQAQQFFGPSAVAAWYEIADLEGGEIAPDNDTEEIRNENGEHITTIINREEQVIENSTLQTDDPVMDFLDWLENHYVPVRYALSAGDDGAGTPLHQLHFFPNVTADINSSPLNTGSGNRTRAFTLRAVKKSGSPVLVRATVDMTDSTGWPADLNDAKDTVFGP